MSAVQYRSYDLIHPACRAKFIALADCLVQDKIAGRTRSEFRAFETYRSPARQLELYKQRPPVTQAPPWTSAHQYGLAVDFVAWSEKGWSWANSEDWDHLDKRAFEYGLLRPISWDRPHIESPLWRAVQATLAR